MRDFPNWCNIMKFDCLNFFILMLYIVMMPTHSFFIYHFYSSIQKQFQTQNEIRWYWVGKKLHLWCNFHNNINYIVQNESIQCIIRITVDFFYVSQYKQGAANINNACGISCLKAAHTFPCIQKLRYWERQAWYVWRQ